MPLCMSDRYFVISISFDARHAYLDKSWGLLWKLTLIFRDETGIG